DGVAVVLVAEGDGEQGAFEGGGAGGLTFERKLADLAHCPAAHAGRRNLRGEPGDRPEGVAVLDGASAQARVKECAKRADRWGGMAGGGGRPAAADVPPPRQASPRGQALLRVPPSDGPRPEGKRDQRKTPRR